MGAMLIKDPRYATQTCLMYSTPYNNRRNPVTAMRQSAVKNSETHVDTRKVENASYEDVKDITKQIGGANLNRFYRALNKNVMKNIKLFMLQLRRMYILCMYIPYH